MSEFKAVEAGPGFFLARWRGLVPLDRLFWRDMAIVGFQEEPNSRLLPPRVTCFRTALPALGARLGEALLATIPAHAPAEISGRIIQDLWPMEFVQGESDGPPLR